MVLPPAMVRSMLPLRSNVNTPNGALRAPVWRMSPPEVRLIVPVAPVIVSAGITIDASS